MSSLILRQFFTVSVLFFAGMAAAALYQVVYSAQQGSRYSFASVVRDSLFWLLEGLMASAFLYYGNYGELTAGGAMGFGVGIFFWQIFMRKKIHNLFCTICDTMRGNIKKSKARQEGTARLK